MYLEFWAYLGMARHPEVEMFVMNKEVYIHRPWKQEAGQAPGPQGEALGSAQSHRQRVEGKAGAKTFIVFSLGKLKKA